MNEKTMNPKTISIAAFIGIAAGFLGIFWEYIIPNSTNDNNDWHIVGTILQLVPLFVLMFLHKISDENVLIEELNQLTKEKMLVEELQAKFNDQDDAG